MKRAYLPPPPPRPVVVSEDGTTAQCEEYPRCNDECPVTDCFEHPAYIKEFECARFPESCDDDCSLTQCRAHPKHVEAVDHPAHYNALDIECIDVIQHFNFCRGNTIKYVWRCGLKGDDAIQDLEKAKWYLQREITRLRKEQEND